MSCERNANKVGRHAGPRAGVAAVSGKFSHAAGGILYHAAGLPAQARQRSRRVNQAATAARQRLANATQGARQKTRQAAANAGQAVVAAAERLDEPGRRLGQATAPATNAALKVIDGPDPDFKRERTMRRARLLAYGGLLGWGAGRGYKIAQRKGASKRTRRLAIALGALAAHRSAGLALGRVRRALGLIKLGTGLAGDLAGWASRTEQTNTLEYERRVLLFFKGTQRVPVWKSRLTPLLNRLDLPGSSRLSGKDIKSSEGVLFEVRGSTWHRGTTILDTPAGERTITHLQGLSLPARHYYFDRPLADEEAAGIALGRAEYRPQSLPGYVGGIGETEQLVPFWATVKGQLIKNRLYHPPQGEEEPAV